MVGAKERRRLDRRPINARAICGFQEYNDIFGRVKNINVDGTYIELPIVVEGLVGKSMNLSVDIEEYGKVLPFTCTVVWSEPGGLGVKFHKPVELDLELF